MNKDTGGQAFPGAFEIKGPAHDPVTGATVPAGTVEAYIELGMSMRDYFAAQSLNGICASGPGDHMTNGKIAAEAYALADAMIAERAK